MTLLDASVAASVRLMELIAWGLCIGVLVAVALVGVVRGLRR